MSKLSYDPEYAAALAPMAEAMAANPQAPLAAGDVAGRRSRVAGSLAALIDSMPEFSNVKRTTHRFPSVDGSEISLVEYRKAGGTSQPSKAVYHIHGGGMIIGNVTLFDKSIAAQCDVTGLPFFSVEYRLAPEHPHPTPLDDCFAGLQWLSAHAGELGVDKSKIVIFGESAGGGLAAGTALMARDRKLSPPLAKQVLIYPMIDDTNQTQLPDIEPYAFWKNDDNITGWKAYLGDAAGSPDADISEYAAPARAKDLAGLPPTYIDVGGLDIFVHEDLQFASRLAQAGVPVEFHLYPGLPHAYQVIAPNITLTKMANENVRRALVQG